MSTMQRRLAVVALAALVFAGCGGAPTAPSSTSHANQVLTVAGFGGATQQQMHAMAGQIFEQLTGAQVKYVVGTSRKHLKTLQAAKGGPVPFDLVLLDGIIQQMAAKDDLLYEGTADDLPNLEQLMQQAKPRVKGGPAFQFFSVGILYDPAALSEAGLPEPGSWADFWRPELKGHVAVPSIFHAAGLDFVQAAARVAGGDPSTIEGLKKGVVAIAKLEPAIIYGGSLDVVQEAMQDGKVWMAPMYNSRAFHWIGEGLRAAYNLPREGGFGHLTTINVVKGTPRKQLADLFANLLLTPGYQYAQAIETPYGPVNKAVIGPLAHFPDVTARFPFGEDGLAALYVPNWDTMNSLRGQVEAAWFEQFPKEQKE